MVPPLPISFGCQIYLFLFAFQIVKMVEASTWSDRLVELEIWSRLAVLAYNNDNHSLVMHCGEKAMIFAASDQCLANKHPKKMDR